MTDFLMHWADNGVPYVGTIAVWTIVAIIYMLPTFVAHSRAHRNTLAIGALNLLSGWTLFGWVISLVWSLTSNIKQPKTA